MVAPDPTTAFFNPDVVNAAWILAVLIFAFLANVIIGMAIELWHFRKDKALETRIRERGARCRQAKPLNSQLSTLNSQLSTLKESK